MEGDAVDAVDGQAVDRAETKPVAESRHVNASCADGSFNGIRKGATISCSHIAEMGTWIQVDIWRRRTEPWGHRKSLDAASAKVFSTPRQWSDVRSTLKRTCMRHCRWRR
jgi:hypothetical protein